MLKHLKKRKSKNQVYYNRLRLVSKFSFLSKMKKLGDRLYYSNFIDRLMYASFGEEKNLYFDVNLNNEPANINSFLLFNKYWNRYVAVSQNELPLGNFSAFDSDLLKLKCSGNEKNFYGLPLHSNTITSDNKFIHLISNFLSALGLSIKLHFILYLALLFFCLFFCMIILYNNGFFVGDKELLVLALNFSFDNINIYFNNEKYYISIENLSTFLGHMDLLLLRYGNGFGTVIGNYYDYYYYYNFFFLKNYIYLFFYKISFFLQNLQGGLFFRAQTLPEFVLGSCYRYLFGLLLDFSTMPVFQEMFGIWWEDNFIFYTDDYFYTGVWRGVYNFFGYLIIPPKTVIDNIYGYYSNFTEIKLILYERFYYPLQVFDFIQNIFIIFIKMCGHVVSNLMFLNQIGSGILMNLHKLYLIKLLIGLKTLSASIGFGFGSKESFIGTYLIQEGFLFKYLGMDGVGEYISMGFEYYTFSRFIFEKKIGFLLYYNGYLYVTFFGNIFIESFSAMCFNLPSMFYLYTTTIIGYCFRLIPPLIFDGEVISPSNFFFLFIKVQFNDLSNVVFLLNSYNFVNNFFAYINSCVLSLFLSLDYFFELNSKFSLEKIFILIPEFKFIGLFDIYNIFLYNEDIFMKYTLFNLIRPFHLTVVFFKKALLFCFFGLHLTQTAWNEGLLNVFTTGQIFLFFENILYFSEFINFIFGKTEFSFFFENRISFIINETSFRKQQLDVYFFIFTRYYINDYKSYDLFEQYTFMFLPEFFLDFYGELWDSLSINKNPVFLNSRRVDLNFWTGAYNILREFGYTLPNHRERFGALINLQRELVYGSSLYSMYMEPAPEVYDDGTNIYGSPLEIELGEYIEIGLALGVHGFYEVYDEEGVYSDVIYYYKDVGKLDPDRKDFGKLIARILNGSFLFGFSSMPFSKLATNGWLFEGSAFISKESVAFTGFSYVTLLALDSFEDFGRYIGLYGGKEFIFTKFGIDVVPFSSFFYNFLVVWRKFYGYGNGLPIGSVDVVFLLDFIIPLYKFIFLIYLYSLFLLNTITACIESFPANDFSSFVGLYLIFFSEFKSTFFVNINLLVFFELFKGFYFVSLGLQNTFISWMVDKSINLDFSEILINACSLLDGLYKDLHPFSSFGSYFRSNFYFRFLYNLMFDEIFTSFSFYDFYLNFEYMSAAKEQPTKPFNILGINSFFQSELNTSIDSEFTTKFLYLNKNDNLYFRQFLNFIFNKMIGVLEPVFKNSEFDRIKREDSLLHFAYFNMLIEIVFTKKTLISNTYSPIINEFILENLFFTYLDEIAQLRLFDYKNKIIQSVTSREDFSKFAASSWYELLLKRYTIRNKGIYGFGDAFDALIFASSFLFFMFLFICIYYLLFFKTALGDVGEHYIFLLYPRLVKYKRKASRDTDVFVYDEEGADVMFEYGFYFFQSADYVFLPYRHFSYESLLKKPSWLYIEDYNLSSFYFNNLNLSGETFEFKNKKILPIFDFWFKNKKSLYSNTIVVSDKYMHYYIILFLTVFIFDYSGELLKYGGFDWFFLQLDLLTNYFGSSFVLMIHPFFFDRLFSITGFFMFVLFMLLIYFLFCYIQFFVLEVFLFTRYVHFYKFGLIILLLINVLFSGRFWEQRLLNFDFFSSGKLKSNGKETHKFMSKDCFDHNSSLGGGSTIDNMICLNSLVDNSFFLDDITKTHLSTLINNIEKDRNISLFSSYNIQTSLKFNFVVLNEMSSDAVRYSHEINTNGISHKYITSKKLDSKLISYKNGNTNLLDFYIDNNKNQLLFKTLLDLKIHENKDTSYFLYGNHFIFLDFIIPNNLETDINQYNLSSSLFENGGKVSSVLETCNIDNTSVKKNNLFLDEIQKYLHNNNKPFLDPDRKKLDGNYILKIPILESHIPDPEYKPDWSFGEYIPTMAEYLKYKGELTGTFFGVGDSNLAYRELLDRSASFVGVEQAWGFTDVHDFYDSSSENSIFFRKEFYDQLTNEKKKRLQFKESGIDFDINISSNKIVPNFNNSLSYDSDARYFRSLFFEDNLDLTMLSTMRDYPLMNNIYTDRRTYPEIDDIESIFHLSYRFDYEHLDK